MASRATASRAWVSAERSGSGSTGTYGGREAAAADAAEGREGRREWEGRLSRHCFLNRPAGKRGYPKERFRCAQLAEP